MKKNLYKKVFTSIFMTVLFLTGCTGFNGRAEKRLSDNNSDKTTRVEFYAANGNYTVSQDELQNTALMVLTSSKMNKSEARSIEDLSSDYIILDVEKSTFMINDDKKIERTADISDDEVNIYTFQFENSKTQEKSFVISTDDRRVGEIIAIADGELTEDLKNTTFMDIVRIGLESHINKTINEWNNQCYEDCSRAVDNSSIMNNPDYKVYRVFCNTNRDNYYYRLPFATQWGQESPSNDFVTALEGAGCPSGCVAVALAQICCNSRYPKYCSPDILTILKNNDLVSDNWDGEYNYYSMKYVDHYEYTPKEYDLKSKGRSNVATLMYDIGKGVKMSYGINSSGTSIANAYRWLQEKGFSCSEIMEYNYSAIEKSVSNDKPVYIRGRRRTGRHSYTGHAWVIDQCAEFKCVMENTKTKDIQTITDNFVHCNWGWNGECNGYYLSGLFNTTYGAKFHLEDMLEDYDGTWEEYCYYIKDNDDTKMSRNYEYDLLIITDIEEPQEENL